MDPAQTGPGVRIPPPVVFLAGLGLGFLLQRGSPVPLLPWGFLSRPLGALLALASAGLALWAFATFRRAHTTVRPDRPASALLTRGPFRLTRNPLYLSLALLHGGLALWTNALWPALMLLPVLLVIRVHVIAREERHLLARFGGDYEAYCRTVRRWF